MKSQNPFYPYHPGMQIAAIPIKHPVGLLISILTVVVCVLGMSFTIYYLIAALAVGAVFCWGIRRYRAEHPPEPPLSLHIN